MMSSVAAGARGFSIKFYEQLLHQSKHDTFKILTMQISIYSVL
jgi:hypothetical protein